jgi:hypothetical protein
LDFQHTVFKAKAIKPPVDPAPTAVNSAVVMQAGHMVGFVSVHLYNERGLVFWTPLFTVAIEPVLPNQIMT